MKELSFNQIKYLATKFLKKHEIEPDLVDLEHELDPMLIWNENKEILKGIIRTKFGKDIEIKIKENKVKFEEEKFNEQQNELIKEGTQKEFEKAIEEIKLQNVSDLSKYYLPLYSYIDTLIYNDKISGLLIHGARGTGKTFNTLLKLEELGQKYTIIKGHSTPLSTYRTLFEHSGEIIVFDDVINLLKSEDILSLLLGALDSNTKTVKWLTSSPFMNIPSEFTFSGKIIIVLNEISQDNPYILALQDRCFTLSLNFSNPELIQMCYILANAKGIPVEVVDYLKEKNKASLENMSLRLLDKVYTIFNTYNHNTVIDWKSLANETLEYNDILDTLIEITNSKHSVKDQISEWVNLTGLSRASFFRYRKRLETN